jgi:signal transduction histidine kinase
MTVLIIASLAGEGSGAGPLQYVVAVLTVAPLALHERTPVLAASIMVLAVAVYAVLGYPSIGLGANGMVIGLFAVAAMSSTRTHRLMFSVAAMAVLLVFTTSRGELTWPLAAQSFVLLAVVWRWGLGVRQWATRARDRAVEASQAAANERLRIAREVHDTVSHHLSVITLHAGLADYVLDQDPVAARKSMKTVTEAGREALDAMRQMLGTLRVDDDPGLADLPELVNRARDAGSRVDLRVEGQRRPLAAGPDLCAYRVVQESLTNVLKHADGSAVSVRVSYATDTVAIRITDDGRGAKPIPYPSKGGSYGIRGMRERAEQHGGTLTAGPMAAGGFEVHLVLPVEPID